jgi:hypothetical protein
MEIDPAAYLVETGRVPAPQDRIPGETAKAYAAFVEYLRLGPERSIDQAAKNLGKGTATLRKWSERHGWVRRAASWDELCAAQERAIQQVLTKEKAVEWVKRQERLKEAEWEIAERCIAKAKELLNRPDVKWSGGDIAKLLDIASKLARLATGLETDRREVTGEGGGPVRVEVDVGPLIRRVYGGSEEGRIIDVGTGTGAPGVGMGEQIGGPCGAGGELRTLGDGGGG